MGLVLVTPPESTPVTLAEVKAQLNIQHTDEDEMLVGLIEAATAFFDGPDGDLAGRALKPQTWDYYLDSFPTAGIKVPLPPLISVDSVNYVDPDTALETLLAVSGYEVDLSGAPFHGWITPVDETWPTTFEVINAVRVRFTCGYPDADSPADTTVPAPIRQAIIMLVLDMYGQGSAFVDRSQTPTMNTIVNLTRHYKLPTC